MSNAKNYTEQAATTCYRQSTEYILKAVLDSNNGRDELHGENQQEVDKLGSDATR